MKHILIVIGNGGIYVLCGQTFLESAKDFSGYQELKDSHRNIQVSPMYLNVYIELPGVFPCKQILKSLVFDSEFEYFPRRLFGHPTDHPKSSLAEVLDSTTHSRLASTLLSCFDYI